LKRFRATGDVAKVRRNPGKKCLSHREELLVIGLILENSGYYLREVCGMIEETCGQIVSPSTVCRIIHKHGFIRKKLLHSAKQRSLQYRGEYLAEIQLYHPDCFVFINETGCSSRDHT